MSISSGSIVGADGVPTGKLIVRASPAGDYDFTFCLNREIMTPDGPSVQLNYQVLVPQKVGCDIDLENLGVSGTVTVMVLRPTGVWEVATIVDNLTVSYDPKANGSLGCFYNGALTIVVPGDRTYCDIIVCVDGSFALPPCKVLQGCENFCVYISKQADTTLD